MKPIFTVAVRIFLIAVLALPSVVTAAPGAARDALQRFLDGLETFSAEFTQTLTDETGFVLQEAEGSLSLAVPDRLRWQLRGPFEQWIVADGEYVWLYDPELRQATVRPLEQALEATPLALLTQPHRLDERFDVAEEPAAEGLRLVLVPRAREADFTRLELDLTVAGELRTLAFVDVFGQRTEMHLRESRRNPALGPAAFQFIAPPGTDVYRP